MTNLCIHKKLCQASGSEESVQDGSRLALIVFYHVPQMISSSVVGASDRDGVMCKVDIAIIAWSEDQ